MLAHLFAIFIFIIYSIQTNVRDVLCFVRCTLLFVRCVYVFVRKNNYLFMLLKFLFPVSEINDLVLKKYFLKKCHANIGKCGLVLKISLQETQECNQNLILILSLESITFFSLAVYIYA